VLLSLIVFFSPARISVEAWWTFDSSCGS